MKESYDMKTHLPDHFTRSKLLCFALPCGLPLCSLLLCSVLLWGCQGRESGRGSKESGEAAVTRDIFAMDTYMTITAYGDSAGEAVEEAIKEIQNIENRVSTEKEESEIFQANEKGTVRLSKDTAAMIQEALFLCESTGGCFDISIYPLMKAWGFTTQKYRIPKEEEIKGVLKNVGPEKIQYHQDSMELTLLDGAQIDLGGIGKGYTSGRIMEIFRQHGVGSGLVSLGGNVQMLGTKPDGTDWRIAIENPKKDGSYVGIIETRDKAIITSGSYERFFEKEGTLWHHILNPKTGYPARSGLSSVSIVSDNGMLADGLSTALFVMGKEKALSYWREHSSEFDVVLVEEDGSITISEGLKDIFTSENPFQIADKSDGIEKVE